MPVLEGLNSSSFLLLRQGELHFLLFRMRFRYGVELGYHNHISKEATYLFQWLAFGLWPKPPKKAGSHRSGRYKDQEVFPSNVVKGV